MANQSFDEVMRAYEGIIPVPLVDIAKDLGLSVFLTRRFKDSKSGEILKEDGEYMIYINANHPYNRTRFTLAHEIAHFKLHKEFLDEEKEIEDFTGKTFSIKHVTALPREKKTRNQKEIEADNFAAELLMPEDEFVRVWEQKDTIEEVADVFEVSAQAAEIRARVLLAKRQEEAHEKPLSKKPAAAAK